MGGHLGNRLRLPDCHEHALRVRVIERDADLGGGDVAVVPDGRREAH